MCQGQVCKNKDNICRTTSFSTKAVGSIRGIGRKQIEIHAEIDQEAVSAIQEIKKHRKAETAHRKAQIEQAAEQIKAKQEYAGKNGKETGGHTFGPRKSRTATAEADGLVLEYDNSQTLLPRQRAKGFDNKLNHNCRIGSDRL